MARSGLGKPFALLCALALALAVLAAAAEPGASRTPAAAPAPTPAWTLHGHAAPARHSRVAAALLLWRGGPTVASTGETVNVFVSQSLAPESEPAGGWAEFVARLTHGPELGRLTSYIATLAEVQQICGARALGCYGANELVSIGEPVPDGTTAEEVVRHEYGHHVAYHRLNTPWPAIHWGPKQWASEANVCGRVQRREAFPGDGGSNYARNPGEAWAEVYRLLDERRAGVTTATWPIVAPSFYPTEAALQAAERDVLQPWTGVRVATAARVFRKGTPRTWTIPLGTSLDGDLRVTASLPLTGTHDVALVTSEGRVLRRAQWISQRAKRLTTTVCGRRSLAVRVTQKGGLGRVTVSVSAP